MEGAPSQTGQMLRFWEAGEFEYQQHLPQGLSREETREKRKTAHFSEHSGERGVREAQVATRLPPGRRQAFWLPPGRRQAFWLCHLEGWMRVSFEKLKWVRAEIAAVVPGNVTKVACR